MSLSTRAAPHLPYLRRYARAITGSQSAGDAYVAAILEKLIEDITLYPESSSDRVSLFKLFSRYYGKLDIDLPEQEEDGQPWEKRAAANLNRLTDRSKQAFLLSAIENFSKEEIAEILETDEAGVDVLIGEALDGISKQMSTRLMIIEDEPLIAMDIKQIVESLGHEVTGIARTHSEASKIFEQTSPRMVLADIQLADGSSGLDAVRDILKKESLPVIFITAFPEQLLSGTRPEPTFLLTKPFDAKMLKALISQVLFFDQTSVEHA